MYAILTFMLCAGVLMILATILTLVLSRHDNVKEIKLKISFTQGVEFKTSSIKENRGAGEKGISKILNLRGLKHFVTPDEMLFQI